MKVCGGVVVHLPAFLDPTPGSAEYWASWPRGVASGKGKERIKFKICATQQEKMHELGAFFVIHFTIFSVAGYTVERWDDWWKLNWKGFVRKAL